MNTSDITENRKIHDATFTSMVNKSKHESSFYKFMNDKKINDTVIMRDLSSYLHATPDTLGNTMEFGLLLLCLPQNVSLVNKIANYSYINLPQNLLHYISFHVYNNHQFYSSA